MVGIEGGKENGELGYEIKLSYQLCCKTEVGLWWKVLVLLQSNKKRTKIRC